MAHPRPAPRPPHLRRDKDSATQYSSSEGEDEATGCHLDDAYYDGDRLRDGTNTARSLGLTADESHISPIENLDHTISRLYSYLSGSEGDIETDHPLTPPSCNRQEKWERRRSRTPSSSSNSSSVSGSRTQSDSEPEHDRTMDTLDSQETGENVYSRINETATLPLSLPPIPPPPLEDALGPAVPPRRNLKRFASQSGRSPDPCHPGSRGAYTEGESDFEPHYLVQTASGNVFVPPATGSPPSSPPLPFPRTVPRTNSLPPPLQIPPPPPSQQRSTPEMLNNVAPNRPGTMPDSGPVDYHQAGMGGVLGSVPPSSSTDRIKLQLKEMEENWARQNASNQGTNLSIPPLPTYPSIQNDFRDYSRFTSASYRVKKHFHSRCTWRLTAIIFMGITVALLAAVAYFLAMKVGNLNWKLEKPLLGGDLNRSKLDPTRHPGHTKGATLFPPTSSVLIVQYPLGKQLEEEIPPFTFWRTQFYMPHSQFVKFNFSLPGDAVIGVYGRRNVQPTHTQYDFFHIMDGSKISSRRKRSIGVQNYIEEEGARDSAFIHYMEGGLWYVFLYNDGEKTQKVSFVGAQYDDVVTDCPSSCHGRGDCVSGQCECFPGYEGWDCGQNTCPVLCQGNGVYIHGQCDCYPGWKGQECSVPDDQCEVPNCSGNGKCVSGRCVCSPGFKGSACNEVDCLSPNCSGNGACVDGVCRCYHGFSGNDCSLPVIVNMTLCIVSNCSGHGMPDPLHGGCRCEMGWTGPKCELEVCDLECVHGSCDNQRCLCDAGWTGALCDQIECDKRCLEHGFCNNGTCICKPGWNGRHCTLDGCPNACNNNGNCQLFQDGWRCSCRDGWKGGSCQVAMEMECEDNVDDDKDGLTDCQDPDCCISISCKDHIHCLTSPDPMEILLRKQPPSSTASFYDRMRFLVEDDSVQSYATLSSFNMSQVSVIRGKVIATDGSPLTGVRVSVVTQPLYGFTLTRELGMFDILVNGGGSVTLQFQRQPFQIRQTTVMVPWNQMITMETVTMMLEGELEPQEVQCPQIKHDHYLMRPIVLSTWQHTQLGSCPSKSTIIPESQVLQESLQIPGTDVYLVYHSSETSGYMSTIMIQLTPNTIPDNLAIVHLRVSVEGLIYEKIFEADSGLKYKFAWDRRNAYNQKVYGIVTARVGVGYQYEGCDRIFWETQSATMSGYDITSSEIGGWNLHIHHTYNFQEGILHKGDGTNIYLKERPRKVVTVLGSGKQRRLDCKNCDGKADSSRLMAPVALASGRDGSLYIGDYNYIRKLSANRQDIANILELNMPNIPYKYFMTVSPLDGKLYISDYETKQVMRVKTMGPVRELTQNMEVIAGDGEQCVPGDKKQCGDKGPATSAKLFYPKGIAINKDGIVFFADGANIRVINREGHIKTMIGSQGQPTHWSPLPCGRVVSIEEVTLHWPTALAINPLDDTLHILDNNMVLKVTKDGQLLIVAGRPLHCPPANPHINPLLTEDQTGPKLANEVILESPQHIAFAPNGHLYIVETDGKFINRVREVGTDGTISHYVGDRSKCSCKDTDCKCFDAKEVLATKILLHSPTAITVTPDNVLHVADMGNLRIHSIVATLPEPDRYGQYEVLYPQTQEMYIFNRYGQHIATKNIITDQYLYNFTYHVNSYYGKLVKVIDSGSNQLTIRRDYTTQAKEIMPPGGQKCKFIMDNMGQLHIFIAADNATTQFTYISNSGLLMTKETSEGHTFLYDYDNNGRLAAVIQPTGERTSVSTDVDASGAIARLSTDNKDKIAMATNGNMLSVLHGQAKTKVSYLHDGALVVEYPFNMAITMETNPHPLLSTEHALHVKRKVIMPDNLIHRLEWRYYLRREGKSRRSKVVDKIGRRMRVGSLATSRHGSRMRHGSTRVTAQVDDQLHDSTALGEGYEGKALMVNGENLLTLEYERDLHSETLYNKDQDEILTVLYNNGGQPIHFLPEGPLYPVNITYDERGHMARWVRGEISVVNIYDTKTGFLREKKIADRANYRYIYKSGTKPTSVILPSGKQYVINYDVFGNLAEVVMPEQGRHMFRSLTTLSLHRKMYSPPETQSPFILDYGSSGRLQHVTYPSTNRRVTYHYTLDGRPSKIYYDWIDIEFKYYEHAGILESILLNDRISFNFSCALVYEPGAALYKRHLVHFNPSGFSLKNATYQYHYDANFRVISLETTLGGQTFQPVNFSYNPDSGRLDKMKSFVFQYPALNKVVIKDSSVEITREFDRYQRATDIWYRFNNYVVFNMEVQYDEMNRVHQWRRKIGSSDLKAYTYVYDIDSNLLEVHLNGQPTWKYEYDANNNIKKATHYDDSRQMNVNSRNQVESHDDEFFIFDKDGFTVQRDNERFQFNSMGQLIRAYERGKYELYYFYDAYGRLVARRDIHGGYLTQFYYADITNRDRITHIFDHSSRLATVLYYDNMGKLFAMEQEGRYFYIALDPMDSPIIIINAMGSVVKQVTYDPLGRKMTDSAPDFHFLFGFQCGIQDHITKLLHHGSKVYDPHTGRWFAPDYQDMLNRINEIVDTPEVVNLYQYRGVVNRYGSSFDLMKDIPSWLLALGYDMESLVPKVSFRGQIRPRPDETSTSRLIPVTSAFECAFERDMLNFIEISTVPRSKVTGMDASQIISSYSPYQYIFGEGIMISSVEGKVMVDVLDTAADTAAMLATTLLNNSYIVDLHYTIHGRDTHYFVKPSVDQAVSDVKDLSLRTEGAIQGINYSVHRHHETSEIMKYVDIRLHANHTTINVRYGTQVWHERERVLKHVRQRVIDHAWKIEKDVVKHEYESVHKWTREQKDELLRTGTVSGMNAQYIRDIELHPELADDPRNIQFVPR